MCFTALARARACLAEFLRLFRREVARGLCLLPFILIGCSQPEESEPAFSNREIDDGDAIVVDLKTGTIGPANQAKRTNGELNHSDAKYLQDVEHLGGFVLGDLAFPGIADALRQQDRATLISYFHPAFAGSLFASSTDNTTTLPFARLEQWKERLQSPQQLDREGFVSRLLQYRSDFADLDFAKLKVIKMKPDRSDDWNAPWSGTGKLILAGKTHDGKVAKRTIRFRCRIDGISEDLPDRKKWLLAIEATEQFRGESDRFLMSDMTSRTGIPVERLRDNWQHNEGSNPYLTGGIYLCDFDGNHRFDLLVSDIVDGLSLYRGKEMGQFEEVTGDVGLPEMGKNIALAI